MICHTNFIQISDHQLNMFFNETLFCGITKPVAQLFFKTLFATYCSIEGGINGRSEFQWVAPFDSAKAVKSYNKVEMTGN